MDLSGISGISSNYQSAKTDASAASSNALQNSLKNVSSDASEDELKGVIKDFESYFVEQMLKEVKSSFLSDDEVGGTAGHRPVYGPGDRDRGG